MVWTTANEDYRYTQSPVQPHFRRNILDSDLVTEETTEYQTHRIHQTSFRRLSLCDMVDYPAKSSRSHQQQPQVPGSCSQTPGPDAVISKSRWVFRSHPTKLHLQLSSCVDAVPRQHQFPVSRTWCGLLLFSPLNTSKFDFCSFCSLSARHSSKTCLSELP